VKEETFNASKAAGRRQTDLLLPRQVSLRTLRIFSANSAIHDSTDYDEQNLKSQSSRRKSAEFAGRPRISSARLISPQRKRWLGDGLPTSLVSLWCAWLFV